MRIPGVGVRVMHGISTIMTCSHLMCKHHISVQSVHAAWLPHKKLAGTKTTKTPQKLPPQMGTEKGPGSRLYLWPGGVRNEASSLYRLYLVQPNPKTLSKEQQKTAAFL